MNIRKGASVEVRSDDFTIAVDSKQFVSHPLAPITLDGAMAVLNYALMTGEHDKLHLELVRLMTRLMHEYKGAKPKGWETDKSGW